LSGIIEDPYELAVLNAAEETGIDEIDLPSALPTLRIRVM
jgi:hypothetical protein